MDETIADQQATSHQLAWLAGIWDGEGTFGIYISRGRYVGRVTISNTCELMINEIVKILDSYGIIGCIWRETSSRKFNHKKAYHLTFNKLDQVKKAIELMLPYLVSKKARAEILLRFVNSRLKYKRIVKNDPVTGHLLGVQKQGYLEEEKSLYEQIRELNTVGIK